MPQIQKFNRWQIQWKLKHSSRCLSLAFFPLFLNTFKMSLLRKAKINGPRSWNPLPKLSNNATTFQSKEGYQIFLPISPLTSVKPVQKGNTEGQKKACTHPPIDCSLHKIAHPTISQFSLITCLHSEWSSLKPLNF